ncbi:hypothetical protein [Planctomyces sp. SH-PL14]|uniref:hypothetical protein n=1 Tax=Planctomyces sp. SH-PL14 TaxID=1632864 RepID=UPI0009461BCA|nr:hypothetical protein [Planctomyces sp. SH-PL14]
MPKQSDSLAALLARFHERQSENWRRQFRAVVRERNRGVEKLVSHGVVTVGQLLERLSGLSQRLSIVGIELISLLRIGQAAPLLVDLMESRPLRMACASAIAMCSQNERITERLLRIGCRELDSSHPDPHWLWTIIEAVRRSDDRRAAELLVRIYEHPALPGSIRGDAADRLGCEGFIGDRRTSLRRRCRVAAILGLTDDSIDVQFWSMYLIGQLGSHDRRGPSRRAHDLLDAIPILKGIAAVDQRIAPGYWWPMSAEAEDALHCLEHGSWPEVDAAERWAGKGERGPMNHEREFGPL